MVYELPQYEIINKINNFETSNLRTTNGILKNGNNSTNNNSNNETHTVKFLQENIKYEIIKHESENEDEQDDESISSANALLYEKLMNLVSDSSIDLSNEQMSVQINRLLSNPNIKHQLQQLHSQLLANPSHYLPQLEKILLSGSNPVSGDHSNNQNNNNNQNNLFNLRHIYPNNNEALMNQIVLNKININNNNNNANERSLPMNLETNPNNNMINNQHHPTARIISRDLKLKD
jgi:hypothetical protein